MSKRTGFALLGPTERTILLVLWREGPSKIGHLIEEIGRERGIPIAYSTVRTTLLRLLDKGMVTHAPALPLHRAAEGAAAPPRAGGEARRARHR